MQAVYVYSKRKCLRTCSKHDIKNKAWLDLFAGRGLGQSLSVTAKPQTFKGRKNWLSLFSREKWKDERLTNTLRVESQMVFRDQFILGNIFVWFSRRTRDRVCIVSMP